MCLFANGAPAQELPTPFQAVYAGSKFPFSAKVTIALARLGDYYRFTMRGSVSATFFKWTDVYDCSVLRIDGSTFYPLEYAHRDSRESRHDVRVRFDWKRRSARVTRGDGTVRELDGLPKIAWDPMSIQVRLRADVVHAHPGTEMTYDLIDKHGVEHRRVRIGGVDEMRWDRYALQVVKARTVDGEHNDAFWFAKNYAWLPVRVSISGVTLDLISSPKDAGRDALPATAGTPGCE